MGLPRLLNPNPLNLQPKRPLPFVANQQADLPDIGSIQWRAIQRHAANCRLEVSQGESDFDPGVGHRGNGEIGAVISVGFHQRNFRLDAGQLGGLVSVWTLGFGTTGSGVVL